MKLSKIKKALLLNSIVWATVMLSVAIVAKGTDVYNSIFILFIGLWYVAHASIQSISSESSRYQCEVREIKKLFGRNN